MIYDFAIIGAGLVGLSTARELKKRFPEAKILLLEKESSVCSHQSGRNSGVIHSGIYYKPGSYKAEFCSRGRQSMVDFCLENNVPFEQCGKLIVATNELELPRLSVLRERGIANGIEVFELDRKQSKEVEPNVECLSSLWVKTTAICDFKSVAKKHFEHLKQSGVDVRLDSKVGVVQKKQTSSSSLDIRTKNDSFEAKFLINCGGLYSDRIARMCGLEPEVRIIPFRGEYYHLLSGLNGLIKGMVYPVPNPDFPFLGVHLTKSISGDIHAGPNAVLAFEREGYKWTDINIKDLAEILLFPAFWKFSSKHFKEAGKEYLRSLSKQAFLNSLKIMVPSLKLSDIERAPAGVRAQAMSLDGKLVEDFMFAEEPNSLHVLNAPSPAATSSLEIAKEIVNRIKF